MFRFLEIATDPSAKPVFFHCRVGKDRTAVMAAVYCMQVQGWQREMALEEMKDFGFKWALFDLKGFVESYSKLLC